MRRKLINRLMLVMSSLMFDHRFDLFGLRCNVMNDDDVDDCDDDDDDVYAEVCFASKEDDHHKAAFQHVPSATPTL